MSQENFSIDQLEAYQDNLGHKPEGFIDINDVVDKTIMSPDDILMEKRTQEEYDKYLKPDPSLLEDDRKPFASGIEDIDNYVYESPKQESKLGDIDVHELDEKYPKIESMSPGNLDYFKQTDNRTTVHKKEKPRGDSNTIRHDFEDKPEDKVA